MKTNGSSAEGKRTIAIVEDGPSVRKALERACRWLGFVTMSYDSSEAFLESEDAVDCLLTDVHLPGINGLELQATIRHDQPTLPVILMTASTNQSIEQRAMAGGAEGFYRKPLELEQLLDCIQRILMR